MIIESCLFDTHFGSLLFSLWLSPTFFGSLSRLLWLTLAHSGSLRRSSAHKALAPGVPFVILCPFMIRTCPHAPLTIIKKLNLHFPQKKSFSRPHLWNWNWRFRPQILTESNCTDLWFSVKNRISKPGLPYWLTTKFRANNPATVQAKIYVYSKTFKDWEL